MAYVNKESKAKIVAEIKKILPKGWKATYAVKDSMVMVCTIRKAPFELVDVFDNTRCDGTHFSVNEYYPRTNCKDNDVADAIEKIIAALNTGNYDNSDPYTDYYDVGHYIELQFGEYEKPFVSNK